MDWYYKIAQLAILSQLVLIVHIFRNYYYAMVKYKRKRSTYSPRTALIVPCKNVGPAFEENITTIFSQDYDNFLLWFVVADKSDPAYDQLCKLKDGLSQSTKAQEVQVFVAGQAQSCSQKLHNLLHCCQKIIDANEAEAQNPYSDIEVLAFADSDVRIRSDWLRHLVWPLRKTKYGATTGYRWYIPRNNNLASLALSAVNAKIAQLLGPARFNQAWGGSMAIRVEFFRQTGLDKIWQRASSDDYALTFAVKRAGKKMIFIPACLVASYESTTWRKLFEFGRRQFLITRVSAPHLWCFGLFSGLYSVLGLWAGAGLAIYAAATKDANLSLYTAVPIVFFTGQLARAVMRQHMASKLLRSELPQMKTAIAADLLGFWLWSIVLLVLIISSAFGNTVCWQGIRYKLLGPTKTIVQQP